MYGSYIDMMNRLNPQDHLYILGDVIDRGSEGIRILKDIMKRQKETKTNPEITFLIGNHEVIFLRCLETIIKNRMSRKDIYNLIKKEEITDPKLKMIKLWMQNGGAKTIFGFLQKETAKEKSTIYKFLYNSYVVLPQKIKGQDYLLVHAMPPKDEIMLKRMKETGKGYKLFELTAQQYAFMLQERDECTYEQAKKIGFTTICGHTPEENGILKNDEQGFIRIDTGCGHKEATSKLALYCVDDDNVEYFEEKESVEWEK